MDNHIWLTCTDKTQSFSVSNSVLIGVNDYKVLRTHISKHKARTYEIRFAARLPLEFYETFCRTFLFVWFDILIVFRSVLLPTDFVFSFWTKFCLFLNWIRMTWKRCFLPLFRFQPCSSLHYWKILSCFHYLEPMFLLLYWLHLLDFLAMLCIIWPSVGRLTIVIL